MSIIFISHSSKNNDQAIKVRSWLRDQGWNEVFLDLDPSSGLAPGQRWQEELKRAGERCAAVVVLISPDWSASKWCITEFLLASQLGKRIFPVIIAPTPFEELPYELTAHFQIVDVSTAEMEAEGFNRLAIGIRRAGLDPKHFPWPPPDDPQRSPYRGLHALEEQDAAIFFGRDAVITKGLDLLRLMRDGSTDRILTIVGSSGSGKSSFLRAGLMARLARDEENFLVQPIVRPERSALTGAQGLCASLGLEAQSIESQVAIQTRLEAIRTPVVERMTRLAEASGETYRNPPPTIVIPIDQGEEFFSRENTEAAAALDLLARVLTMDENSLAIITIRSNNLSQLQEVQHLADIRLQLLNLPALSPGAFKEVIKGPGALADPQIVITDALIDRLIQDLDRADALPLLAFTLQRLYEDYGKDNLLQLHEYTHKLGGFSGAIIKAVNSAFDAARADLGLATSDESLHALARKAFIPWLVQIDDADSPPQRRVARLAELPEETKDLVAKLVDQRLITTTMRGDVPMVEVAHEAILRNWPDFEGWIVEEREHLRTLSKVQAAAREWCARTKRDDTNGTDAWLIHSGHRLGDAEALLIRKDYTQLLGEDGRKYLAECRRVENALQAHERERMDAEQARRHAAEELAAVRLQKSRQSHWIAAGSVAIALLALVTAAFLGFAVNEGLNPREASYALQLRTGLVRPPLPTPVRLCESGSCTFSMGDDESLNADEQPATPPVDFGYSFTMSAHEITFDQYDGFALAEGRSLPSNSSFGRGPHPVINLSWHDAVAYAGWLSEQDWVSEQEELNCSLPTEAEWEYAARAGTTTKYALPAEEGSNDIAGRNLANCNGCGSKWENLGTSPVGQFLPNIWGLYDMNGNVWEWVQDCWHDNYLDAPKDGTAWLEASGGICYRRVVRGGSWYDGPDFLRSANRGWRLPDGRYRNVGFRVVCRPR